MKFCKVILLYEGGYNYQFIVQYANPKDLYLPKTVSFWKEMMMVLISSLTMKERWSSPLSLSITMKPANL